MISADVNAERAILSVDGSPSRVADKDYKMIALAEEALSGRIMVQDPHGGDPIQIVDHVWLLELASSLCKAAAERMVAVEALKKLH